MSNTSLNKKKILITGSSGYVGNYLINLLKKKYDLFCLDIKNSESTNILGNISDKRIFSDFDLNHEYIVINLAAARNDFNISPTQYYNSNVRDHKLFLENIHDFKITHFIHVGSVACIDGEKIIFNKNLSSDDAYRSTKSLQSYLISNWCKEKKIKFSHLMPSAIFDESPRNDTNIGNLQNIVKYLPFIPNIKIKKSVTFLPKFAKFIIYILSKQLTGTYLTIEEPVQNVTEIIKNNISKKKKIITIPFLKVYLYFFSFLILIIWKIFKVDLKLYPNRVKKLFSDTSYSSINYLDKKIYNDFYFIKK